VVGAVIIAGGLTDQELFDKTGAREKALIPICGRPMLDYAIEAVTSCRAIGEIVVACPADFEVAKRDWAGIRLTMTDGHSPIDSIVAGAQALTKADKMLICACDVPLLTPEAVEQFVAEGLEADADCCYPIVEERIVEAEFPGCPRTYAQFRDGRFTSGNIALVARSFAIDRRDRIHQIYRVRKSKVKLAAMLGPMTVVQLLLGTASVARVADRAAKMLDCSLAVVQCRHAEIAFDVDKPSDLELAEQILSEHACSCA